ncbi:MAG: hypothetical protein ABFS46_15085 [Myxococcota bacterium]
MPGPCRPPISVSPVLDDPGVVRELLEQTAPHYPVQRYFASAAEMRAQSGPGELIIAPNFRGDWATAEQRVPGLEPILENPRFLAAAAQLFGSELVQPWGVYSNITWQLPFDQGKGHTDVPAFLGVDRTRYPTWFLSVMGHSGLFEEERIEIATAVSWFYQGEDGGFCYWPDGPDRPPRVHEGDVYNTAFVGDNDRMYHRVRPVGTREQGLLMGMTLETRLEHDGHDAWAIRQDGETRAEMSFGDLRVSVSWKAYVYRDAEQRRRHEQGVGALGLDAVLDRFTRDLQARGLGFDLPADPLHEEPFVELLTKTYVTVPSVFDS